MRTCSVEGCKREHIAQGFCSAHYQSMRKRGLIGRVPRNLFCTIADCCRKHLANGLCQAHYLRMYKHGSLEKLTMRGDPVLARIKAKVQINERGCWIFTGALTENGYGHIRHDRRMRMAHVVTYELKYGPVPRGLELDHFFCDTRACCNPDHVEPVTHQENCRRGKAGHDWATRTRNELGQFQ